MKEVRLLLVAAVILIASFFIASFSGISGQAITDTVTYISECDDSDGGFNLFIPGKIISKDEARADYCISKEKIREFTCSLDSIEYIEIDCPEHYSCDQGKCIAS